MARLPKLPASSQVGPGFTLTHPALLLSAILCTSACKLAVEETSSKPDISTVASVNGRPVSNQEFQAYLGPSLSEETGSVANRREQFRDFLTQQILLDRAEEKGITVTDVELQEQIRDDQEGGTSNTKAVNRLRAFLRIQKLLKKELGPQINVTYPEMRSYYEDNKERFVVKDCVRVLEIRIWDRNEAEEIAERLAPNDVRRFEEIARLHSQGATAAWGGHLGSFERGDLPQEFEEVIFSLKAGGISRIVRSHQGYHIFMAEENIPQHSQRFYEVQAGIFEKLVSEKEIVARDAYLEELLDTASIQIYDEALNFGGILQHAETKY